MPAHDKVADGAAFLPSTIAESQSSDARVHEARPLGHRTREWLDDLEPAIARVFEQMAAHGVVTEIEAATILGGQRELRRFAREFEKHTEKAPFPVKIESVGGVKRYVKDGDE